MKPIRMRNKYTLFIICLLVSLLLAACSNEDDIVQPVSPVSALSDSVRLDFNATIGQGDGSTSRAINLGKTFDYGREIAIWCTINGQEGYKPYNRLKTNLRAEWRKAGNDSLDFDHWLYSHDQNSTISFTSLFIVPNRIITYNESTGTNDTTTYKMDVYAYAPFQSGVTDLTAIPFTIGGSYDAQSDYMYATQNNQTDKNKAIDVTGADQTLELTFAHALAALKIEIANKNTDADNSSQSEITSITIKKSKSSQTALMSSGTFNAIDGSISTEGGTSADSVVFTNVGTLIDTGSKGEAYVMLPPTEYKADGDYIVSFTIDDHPMTLRKDDGVQHVYEYAIPKELFKYKDEDKYGLRAGYKYTFSFTFDNYIHFTQAYADDKWTDDNNTIETGQF